MPSKERKKREKDRAYFRACKVERSGDRKEYYCDYYNRVIKLSQQRSCGSSKASYHKDPERSRVDTAVRSKKL